MVNLVLNVVLILIMGAVGAAISTGISYIVTWVLRLKHVKQYIKMKLYIGRDICSYIILVIQSILLFLLDESTIMYCIEILLLIIVLLCYNEQIKQILNKLHTKGSRA